MNRETLGETYCLGLSFEHLKYPEAKIVNYVDTGTLNRQFFNVALKGALGLCFVFK